MTVTSVKKEADPDILRIGLSDGSSFLLRISCLEALSGSVVGVESADLFVGTILDEDLDNRLRLAGTAYLAEKNALQLIALSEQSSAGLNQKLQKKGIDSQVRTLVLKRLIEAGLLDDERFASLWLASRIRRKTEGRSRLVAGLRKRGISASIADRVVNREFDFDAEAALVRSFLTTDGIDQGPLDTKVRKALHEAGFSSAAIRLALEDWNR
jgi:regulatory protein